MSNSRIAECINERCPFSGKPVGADSLTRYGGRVVGFCNPGTRAPAGRQSKNPPLAFAVS